MQRKYLALAISIVICLGATLFFLKPTTSQTLGQYDPWADINDDGRINILDAINLGGSFGTAGDPTRNVTVNDHVLTWTTGPLIFTPYMAWSCINNTVGYRQATIRIENTTGSHVLNSNFFVSVESVVATQNPVGVSTKLLDAFNVSSYNVPSEKTYDITGTSIKVTILNGMNVTSEIAFYMYMNSIPNLQSVQSTRELESQIQTLVSLLSRPNYEEQGAYVNTSQGMTNDFSCGGYSRLGIAVHPESASMDTYDVTLSLSALWWGYSGNQLYSVEYLPSSALNVTFYAFNGTINWSNPPPFLTETKASYCRLIWTVIGYHNLPPDWWITFDVYGYLRND